MQKYPKSLVRQIEKVNGTFWFEYRNGVHTAHIKDKDTGEVIATATGGDELQALHKAAAMSENRPKKLSNLELERKVAELEAKLAKPPDPPPSRGRKPKAEDPVPEPEQEPVETQAAS